MVSHARRPQVAQPASVVLCWAGRPAVSACCSPLRAAAAGPALAGCDCSGDRPVREKSLRSHPRNKTDGRSFCAQQESSYARRSASDSATSVKKQRSPGGKPPRRHAQQGRGGDQASPFVAGNADQASYGVCIRIHPGLGTPTMRLSACALSCDQRLTFALAAQTKLVRSLHDRAEQGAETVRKLCGNPGPCLVATGGLLFLVR